MCGRLALTKNYKSKIQAIFDEIEADMWLPPRYNITPAQQVPAILDATPEKLTWISWGFPPTQPKRPPLINARAETADQLPTFREAFQSHRCVILADGFYEWKRDPALPRPQPYFFRLADSAAFALAGLWRVGDPASCVILTTEANRIMQPIHDRMPVILTPDTARMWLRHETHSETLRAMLQPFSSDAMHCHPVSDRVNRAMNEGEQLIEPVQVIEQSTFGF